MVADDGLPVTLTDRVTRLAKARARLAEVKDAVSGARYIWEQKHTDLLLNEAAAISELAAADQALRQAVVVWFTLTGETKPTTGVEVVQKTVLKYEDAPALEWAKGAGVALKLDAKTFEKIAPTLGLPFVTVSKEPSVRVATTLPLE